VTCKVLPEPDPDATALEDGLLARRHAPVAVAWDDPEAPEAEVDVLVLRSTWNYYERPGAFLEWVERAGARTPMVNAPAVVRWNLHKGYLRELAGAGVPVVPTEVVARGDAMSAAERIVDRFGRKNGGADGGGGVVIKPAIGAASFGARRFARAVTGEALAWLERLAATGDALIQPYLDGFRDPGERALVWIDGEWTHAIEKRPRFAGEHECAERGHPPTGPELAVAERALAAVAFPVRYARADLVHDGDGRIVLSELELIEPSLYFQHGPASALARFIGMIERLAR
jgi:hypothetical protein